MIDNERLKEVLVQYKSEFVEKQWPNEKYKWEAVKCFQENWDVNSDDFAGMLNRSLAKTGNLLVSYNNFPGKMICEFAEASPEEVRAMFLDLFDESKDVFERMNAFKMQSEVLLEKYGNGAAQHYQYENAISVYLWLRFPDKYYIYKYSEVRAVSRELRTNYSFKKGAITENLHNFLNLYNELNDALKQDEELKQLPQTVLTDTCHSDPELKTLTIDVGFYISRHYGQKDTVINENVEWYGTEYDPGLTVEDWSELLKDGSVFTVGALQIMKRMKDYGGTATCSQLAEKYGKTMDFYRSGSVSLAKRICKKKEIMPRVSDEGKPCWWRVLYTGRYAKDDEKGVFAWKLRDELSEALDAYDLSDIELYDENEVENEYDEIVDVQSEDDVISNEYRAKPYTKEDFLNDVYMPEDRYNHLVAVLRNKKNIILQGAPGVGKTFSARRLAWSMLGTKDDSHIEFVQFHQSYSYEDFVMGYKPVKDGFELKYGIFYRFCQKAANQPDQDFFFIIDEINRGNLSKIFGELLMLIEKDYRGHKATLAYSGMPFSVPKNLYIIGMMNTADRSLAMIDYALRRRFSFIEIEPGFDSEGFMKYQNSLDSETLNELVSRVKELNQTIALDKSLGKGFCIGHSYFCGMNVCTDERLREIVEYDILPMLNEYWFDEPDEYRRWKNILQGVFQ